ncbi:MAG: hypothetical protein BAA01_08460 [Bacillus thermozeamaize]|uniref:RDD domain-containing protein n=1 Tax=Bacillus thermozeamaize TaxID=230954 RepID=A0A1Y3PM06_9BACI|nr:MAG: hypothetical protein BAA01_08460 [Bacillus thermozeamaize]
MGLSLKRLAAYWIDFMLVASILIAFQLLIYFITSGIPFKYLDRGYEIEIWVLLTMSLPTWLYFILFERFSQKTIGKRLLRLKVKNEEGTAIHFKQALLRTCIKLLPWELTHLMILVPDPWWSIEKPGNVFLIYIPNLIMFLYILVLFLNGGVKGVHDYLARTQVSRL